MRPHRFFILILLLLAAQVRADYPLELIQTIQLPPNISWDVQHWMDDSTYGWACVNNDSIFYRTNLTDSTTAVRVNIIGHYGCPMEPARRAIIYRSSETPDQATVAVIAREGCDYTDGPLYDLFARITLPEGNVLDTAAVLEEIYQPYRGWYDVYTNALAAWPPPPLLAQGLITTASYDYYRDPAGDNYHYWGSASGVRSPVSSGSLGGFADAGSIGIFSRFDQLEYSGVGLYREQIDIDSYCPPDSCYLYASHSQYHRLLVGGASNSMQYCNRPYSYQAGLDCPQHAIAAQRDSTGVERVVLSNGECRDPISFALLWQNPSINGNPLFATRMFDSPDERILSWTGGSFFNVFDAATGALIGATDPVLGAPQYLLKQPNKLSEMVTYDQNSRIVRIYRSTLDTLPACPNVSPPFADDFYQPQLDSCWYWINEDARLWSLSLRPGCLTIEADTGSIYDYTNQLLHRRASGQHRIVTHLSFFPNVTGLAAGIALRYDRLRLLQLQVAYFNLPQISLRAYNGTTLVSEASVPFGGTDVYLSLTIQNNCAVAEFSTDDSTWQFVGLMQLPWLPYDQVKEGLFATCNHNPLGRFVDADFDYISYQSLAGTTVFGDVSGIWNEAGSPYYVAGQAQVPANQTLVLQPGTDVRFVGNSALINHGEIRAIGTVQDSIRFMSAFPLAQGGGITVAYGSDSSRFAYCSFNQLGEALGLEGPWASVAQCTFTDNRPALHIYGKNTCISESVFQGNSADWGGAFNIYSYGPDSLSAHFDHCIFDRNRAQYVGGAGFLYVVSTPSDIQLNNCALLNNFATTTGRDIYVSQGAVAVTNSILWADSFSDSGFVGNVVATFSDILGGYPGPGNINADPQFVDAASGDFHLQASSPCINSGDPYSPLDPNDTRADMGAFPYGGTGSDQPPLVPLPLPVDWGEIHSDSAMQSLWLINNATISAVITATQIDTPFTILNLPSGSTVPAGDTLAVMLSCRSHLEGEFRDTLHIAYWLLHPDTLRIPLHAYLPAIPAPPEGLTIRRVDPSSISLNWQPVTHSIGGQPITPSSYVIYAALTEAGPYAAVGTSASASFVHSGIIPAHSRYFYRVTAVITDDALKHEPSRKSRPLNGQLK